MRTVLTTSFFLACALAALSVSVLFTASITADDILLAGGTVVVAAVLYGVRHAYLVRFGRLGLMKPKLWWKPLKPDQRAGMIQASAAGAATTFLSNRASGATDDIALHVRHAMAKIDALGDDRMPCSDDELESERRLLRFIETHRANRSAPPLAELRGVRRTDVFHDLRKMVDDWYAKRAAGKSDYDDWRASVGTIDQSHLLRDGWVAFLESQPGPDIRLWHGIATDFHELAGDRLEAAFWILGQPECDRGTASDFIAGCLSYRLSADYADLTGPDPHLDRFLGVVCAYNDGAYPAHSIKTGPFVGVEVADPEADRILSDYEAARSLTGLPRPQGLLNASVIPADDAARGYGSPYAFWDDAGLHLAYPGPNWKKAA